MALEKTISVNNSGVNATYWRITGVNVDMLGNQTNIVASGYTTKAARDSGLSPITKLSFHWYGANNPITAAMIVAGTVLAACYTKMKAAAPAFTQANPLEGATDI